MGIVFVTLELVMHAEPVSAVERVKAAVSQGGAVITGATRFSNKDLSFNFEVNAEHLAQLGSALDARGSLDAKGRAQLSTLPLELEPGVEVLGQLHVTLVHDLPDQRVEVPKVPG